MKNCIRCNNTKPIEEFHKHSGMKDGRLNKCRKCVLECVDEWRKKNPESRKQEYLNRKPKLGITKTMEEYIKEKQKNAKGLRVRSFQYSHKRRTSCRRQKFTEFDQLVMVEACDLVKRREKITGFKWHIDHIVPLCHRLASGLHNGYNLQVVPAAWNVKKGNRTMDSYFPII